MTIATSMSPNLITIPRWNAQSFMIITQGFTRARAVRGRLSTTIIFMRRSGATGVIVALAGPTQAQRDIRGEGEKMRTFLEVLKVALIAFLIYAMFPDKLGALFQGALEHGSHILPF